VVMRVDSFGNLVTNFRQEDLPEEVKQAGKVNLQIGSHSVSRLVDTFALGKAGEAIAYLGSNGYVEVAINKGNAAKTLGLSRGAVVTLQNS
jgi:S-adenosyl-L-methionine hydrolase (adenosine-forming)